MSSVPVFCSFYKNPITEIKEVLYIEALPLIYSVHYSDSGRNSDSLEMMTELSEVKSNFVSVFNSMYNEISFNAFDFKNEFSNMVTSSFLDGIITPMTESNFDVMYASGRHIKEINNLYKAVNFIEFRNFDNINLDFIDNINNDIFSKQTLRDIFNLLIEKVYTLYDTNNFKSVLYPYDWGVFAKNIREKIVLDFGINYVKL